jgi:SPP1 gp7 family putative phage head morphogenesis protein
MNKKETELLLKYLERSLKAIQKDIVKNYKKALDEIRVELIQLEEKNKFTEYDITKYGRLENLKALISDELKNVYKSNYKLIDTNRKSVFLQAYIKTLESFEMTPKIKIDMVKTIISNPIYNANFADSMKNLTRQDLLKISSALNQGFIQGKTVSEISNDIKTKVLNIEANRAMTIARTETQRALSQGKEESYQKLIDKGYKIRKVWITAKDERVREQHQELDGKYADDDGYFHGWTIENKMRHDVVTQQPCMSGYSSFDINCRCSTYEEVLEENEEQQYAGSIEAYID